MGMSIGTLKPSMTILYNGSLYIVVNCEHAKIARGAAFCRVKLKNLKNAQVLDCTLRDSDNVNQAFIEKRKLQYLYREGTHYHFLDLETYEDMVMNESIIRESACWLKDNLELIGIFFENEFVDLELPASVELKVIETNPGFRGDTVKAGNKPAKLETGIVISVPLFINNNETIKVDTRTKTYLGRV